MVEEVKEKKEEVKEEPKDLLARAWDKLFYEGVSPDGYFWCKGFTREEEGVILVDAVIAEPGAAREDWTYEGEITVTHPVIIHPIVK